MIRFFVCLTSGIFPSLNGFIIFIPLGYNKDIRKKTPHNMLAPHHQDDMTHVLVEPKPYLAIAIGILGWDFCIQFIAIEAQSRLVMV